LDAHEVIIIGAGPAGLFTAIHAAEAGRLVLILEKQPNPGRKLLLTGSAQCNFTHAGPITDFLQAYGDHGRFLKPALYHFTNWDAVEFFKQIGVDSMMAEETGKVFPKSRRSADILKVLMTACRERQVDLHFQQDVTRIDREADGGFRVRTTSGEYFAQRVVIATGGQSYPATGSTGDGYAWAQALGHTLVPPRPGLAPFFIRDFPLASLAGTSFKNLNVTLWRNGKKIATRSGDLLLTHHGISGPVVHNLARYALPGDTAAPSFTAEENPERFKQEGLADLERSGKLTVQAWMKKHPLTQALSQRIMALAEVKPTGPVAQMSRDKRLLLLRLLSAFPLEIEALGDFNVAMVTCGGVALDEVNPKTLESRLVKGLYFAGEVLDIDGDSGGYDLQAAWSTGALAGSSLGR